MVNIYAVMEYSATIKHPTARPSSSPYTLSTSGDGEVPRADLPELSRGDSLRVLSFRHVQGVSGSVIYTTAHSLVKSYSIE